MVREGGLETLIQVIFTICIGAAISNLVCFLLFPETATDALRYEPNSVIELLLIRRSMHRSDISNTLNSYSTLLEVLTRTFVLDDEIYLDRDKLQKAVAHHQSSFTSLKKNLAESKSEWVILCRSTNAYDDAVKSLNKLAQHLGGLRSGTSIESEIIRNQSFGSCTPQSVEDARLKVGTEQISEVVSALAPPVESLAVGDRA